MQCDDIMRLRCVIGGGKLNWACPSIDDRIVHQEELQMKRLVRLVLAASLGGLLIDCPAALAAEKKEVYARNRHLTFSGDSGNDLVHLLAIITGRGAGDHTYYCEKDSKGRESCYSTTGGNTNGAKLSNTTSHEKNTNVKCVYRNASPGGACHIVQSNLPTKRNGTCHQETNHALRTGAKGGPTVRDAQGYDFTKSWWGVYGTNGLDVTCKAACKD